MLLPTFRHLYEQRSGHVLLSTSAAGLFGGHGLPAYSASKAGLIGLMQSLSLEGASHEVFVNAIAPFARTQMTEASLEAAAVPGLAPDEIAAIVAGLLAPDCRISGEVIVAAAGRAARAKMLCGASQVVSGDDASIDAVLRSIANSPVSLEHPDAITMFQSFIGEH